MSSTIYLHVGLPKSGTTFLQTILVENQQRLKEEQGLLFPGERWGDQVQAVQDVRQMRVPRRRRAGADGAWGRLVDEMLAWHGNSIVSMEWLCAADPAHIEKIVTDLSPARVEVIFTVRDLARTLPAAWQEFIQDRRLWTWSEFLSGVSSDDPQSSAPGTRFWAQQDIGGLLSRWLTVVPPDRTHVVTLPHPGAGSDVLWRRVCQVLDVDGSSYSAAMPDRNVSLGVESAELMRRLNHVVREVKVPRGAYYDAFRRALAKKVLASRAGDTKLVLPGEYHDWVREAAARQVAAIRETGVDVVGDLAELQPYLDAADAPQPDDMDESVLLDASLYALVMTTQHLDEVRVAADKLERRNAAQTERLRSARQRVRQLESRIRTLEEPRPWRARVRRRMSRPFGGK